jgi:hypothetical protein
MAIITSLKSIRQVITIIHMILTIRQVIIRIELIIKQVVIHIGLII